MRYVFELVENESEQLIEEGSEGFDEAPLVVEIEDVRSVEEAIFNMKQECNWFSNGDWEWSSDDLGVNGELRFGNKLDGLLVEYSFSKS